MSYHLGIAHFPVLHRQLTSPTSATFRETSPNEDLTQDSKDVLIERLNDLITQLSQANSLEDGAVSAIHSQVDKIERVLRGGDAQTPRSPGLLETPREDDTFWGPATPTRNLKMRLPHISPKSGHSPVYNEPKMDTSRAAEVAKAAEDLSSKLATTVAELQKRKEESDQVHDLLLTKVEQAAERILLLEYRIAEMEDDFEANQSELKYLRIQLKAIEAQASPYIPRSEDPELTQAIKNWKIDWEDIDRKSKARRQKCLVSLTQSSSDRSTLVDGT